MTTAITIIIIIIIIIIIMCVSCVYIIVSCLCCCRRRCLSSCCHILVTVSAYVAHAKFYVIESAIVVVDIFFVFWLILTHDCQIPLTKLKFALILNQ